MFLFLIGVHCGQLFNVHISLNGPGGMLVSTGGVTTSVVGILNLVS